MDKVELREPEVPPRLQDLGISHATAHRYQTIASLPAPAFETHIARTKAAGVELTSAGVYREVFSISVRAEGMRANRVMILFTPARHEADGIGSP